MRYHIHNKISKLFIILLFTIMLSKTTFAQSSTVQTLNGNTYILSGDKWYRYDTSGHKILIADRRLIVKYNTSASTTDITAFEAASNLTLLNSNILGYYTYYLASNTTDIFIQANLIKNSSLVSHVNVDLLFPMPKTTEPHGGNTSEQWHINWIDAPGAWETTTGSPDVTVAAVDCGCFLDHEDLRGSIYENPGEDAWTPDQYNPANGNGADDDGNNYIDDWKGWNFGYDNTTGTGIQNNDVRTNYWHGNMVVGIIGERSGNNIGYNGIAGGNGTPGTGCKVLVLKACDLVQVGANTFQEHTSTTGMANAIMYAVSKQVKIINISFGGAASELLSTDDDKVQLNAAIKTAYDNGVLITGATGNEVGTDGVQVPVDFPANSQYVMAVGGNGYLSNNRYVYANFGPEVSVSAPAQGIWSTTHDALPEPFTYLNYDVHDGTSFAAPMVAATAALMRSVNPCIGADEIRGIIEQTATPSGDPDYNMNWNPVKPGHCQQVGYGTVNAHRAVLGAIRAKSDKLDLLIRDSYADLGYQQYYEEDINQQYVPIDQMAISQNESPDIWVRNDNDGLTNWQHQNPDAASGSVYIYVRVHNKSCVPSTGNEKLSVYWSHASNWSSWPLNWNGSDPSIGDKIITTTIPALQPGEQTIIQIHWENMAELGHNPMACILARIEDVPDEPINTYEDIGRFDMQVDLNNAVAIKNVTLVNEVPGKGHVVIDGHDFPNGGYMYTGNALNTPCKYNIRFYSPKGVPDITRQAEVRIFFDDAGWGIVNATGQLNQRGIRIIRDKEIVIDSPDVSLSNIPFPSGVRIPIYVGFNFYSDSITNDTSYYYRVTESFADSPDHALGVENYSIKKYLRNPFKANAGPDKYVIKNAPVVLTAMPVPDAVSYNWYDSLGQLVDSGRQIMVTSNITQTYRLQVLSPADGFKDYDDVTVHILSGTLVSFYPNPTGSTGILTYSLDNVSNAYITLVQAFSQLTLNIPLDTAATTQTLDLSQLSAGIYTAVLVCNGTVTDAINIQKQ